MWGRRPKSWIALNSVLSRVKQTGIHPRRMLWWKNHERSFPHVQVKPLYAVIQSVGRFELKRKLFLIKVSCLKNGLAFLRDGIRWRLRKRLVSTSCDRCL